MFSKKYFNKFISLLLILSFLNLYFSSCSKKSPTESDNNEKEKFVTALQQLGIDISENDINDIISNTNKISFSVMYHTLFKNFLKTGNNFEQTINENEYISLINNLIFFCKNNSNYKGSKIYNIIFEGLQNVNKSTEIKQYQAFLLTVAFLSVPIAIEEFQKNSLLLPKSIPSGNYINSELNPNAGWGDFIGGSAISFLGAIGGTLLYASVVAAVSGIAFGSVVLPGVAVLGIAALAFYGGYKIGKGFADIWNDVDSIIEQNSQKGEFGITITGNVVYIHRGGGGETGTVTDIDGNVYKIVKIGNQWWMAENLKVTHYRNGDAISNVTDNSQWSNLTMAAYCVYNNNKSNADTYGCIYNWYAADDSRKIAPTGWHVPSDAEWKELERYLGMSQSAADVRGWRGTNEGGKLKEVGFVHWKSPNTGATNESGFLALPSGNRYPGTYNNLGIGAWFWTSTNYGSDSAWNRYLLNDRSGVSRDYSYKRMGFSIRCVRD